MMVMRHQLDQIKRHKDKGKFEFTGTIDRVVFELTLR